MTDTAFSNTLAFAEQADAQDPLAHFRQRFAHPTLNGKPPVYFAGNSLGLQPLGAREALEVELDDWSRWGVEGHFHARNPWVSYHEALTPPMARLLGAKPEEVVCMNSLTTNLHLLFVSFYRPTRKRFRIVCESHLFPSDRYLLESQVRFHGFDPDEAIVEVKPRDGEQCLRQQDILECIARHADEVALVFFGAVNYFTGQLFDLASLTRAAHAAGAIAGFDLAHAAGNVPLTLNADGADFAAWCSYKYLNAGPGNVGGIFVHERHARQFDLPRFAGWWGHDKERRFLMEPEFRPIPGAEGWQLSNAPVFGMAVKKVSLDIFDEAGMAALRKKSLRLTGFLEHVVGDVVERSATGSLEIVTPASPAERGAQLSLRLRGVDRRFFSRLGEAGVVADFREPDVVRMAPAPLYNSFADVYRAGQIIAELIG